MGQEADTTTITVRLKRDIPANTTGTTVRLKPDTTGTSAPCVVSGFSRTVRVHSPGPVRHALSFASSALSVCVQITPMTTITTRDASMFVVRSSPAL